MKIESIKIESCSVQSDVDKYSRVDEIVGKVVEGDFYVSLLCFQRPLWIKDDITWETIVKAVRLELPVGFEIK